jgi:oligoribonuclease
MIFTLGMILGIFLDTETNGLDPFKNRILEIAIKIVDLRSGTTIASYESIVRQSSTVWKNSDPTSLQINGFTWDMLSLGKEEKTVGSELKNFFKEYHISRENSFFICQNPSFDRAFFYHLVSSAEQEELNLPYHWLDLASMYWALNNKKMLTNNIVRLSKNAIAESLGLPSEKMPHRAINGVDHLLLCYQALLP